MNPVTPAPRGDVRILYNADLGLPIRFVYSDAPKEEDLYCVPDHLAEGGVDVYAQDVFNSGFTLWESKFNDLVAPGAAWQTPRAPEVFAAGLDPIEILVRRSHHHGMKFVAGFRMSDRHHRGLINHPKHSKSMGSFYKEHTDWWIKDFPYMDGALDFNHQGVRDWMFNTMEEVVQGYDVDGLELNYMRYPHIFPIGHPEIHKPIQTRFTARLKEMLDAEGKKRGKKLTLGVLVPQTLEECEFLSLDVPAWINGGLVDYVVPCDFGCADFDAPYDEFAALTRESDCLLYPGAHPYPSRDPSGGGYHWVLLSLAGYRGLANNFYSQGADGFYIYNFIYHWFSRFGVSYPGPMDMYPRAFQYLKELRDPEALRRQNRHYISFPMITYMGLKDRKKKIVLERSEAPTSDQYVFRAAEDFGGAQKALVKFSAVGLVPGDEIQVTFNGEVVPPEQLTRTYHENGRRIREQGAFLDAYTTCRFVPATPAARTAQNTLQLELLKNAPGAAGEIRVQEIELAVSADETDPADVMRQIHHVTPPPVESLAGYHPEVIHAFYDSTENGTTGHVGAAHHDADGTLCGSKGAQSFELDTRSRITKVQICMYGAPKPPEDEPLHLSIHRDQQGVPADEPVSAEARATCNPQEHREELTFSFVGYYAFAFEKGLVLDPGTYWLVFEADPPRQMGNVYFEPFLAVSAAEHYPRGRYMTYYSLENWQAKYAATQGWREIDKDGQPVCAFFSVHGEPAGD